MFIYEEWDMFCSQLEKFMSKSFSAKDLLKINEVTSFFILKHDVETNVKKALMLAKIENKYKLKGSYYVQAYLLNNSRNIKMLKEIQALGHEVSYHYDVLDSNSGDFKKAIIEFEENKNKFEELGFKIETVCQHGNPVIERKGYTSNRDFFRNEITLNKYSNIIDIVVNFKKNISEDIDYCYFSDAGYGWKLIFDIENNDKIDSSKFDKKIDSLNSIIELIDKGGSVIISTHPHRWEKSYALANVKKNVFMTIRRTAKFFIKIEPLNRLMSKFYFVAKKI